MSPNEKSPSMDDLMQLAASPAGQQLMAMLRQCNPESLQLAMKKAASGDLEGAKAAVSQLMQDPQIKKLLDQMGR